MENYRINFDFMAENYNIDLNMSREITSLDKNISRLEYTIKQSTENLKNAVRQGSASFTPPIIPIGSKRINLKGLFKTDAFSKTHNIIPGFKFGSLKQPEPISITSLNKTAPLKIPLSQPSRVPLPEKVPLPSQPAPISLPPLPTPQAKPQPNPAFPDLVAAHAAQREKGDTAKLKALLDDEATLRKKIKDIENKKKSPE